jgi:hypothetical protein
MGDWPKKAVVWLTSQPIFAGLAAILTVYGYINIYLYGFRLGVPPPLRPFLDSYFYSTLALARVLVLTIRLALARFPLKVEQSIDIGTLVITFSLGSSSSLDRVVKTRLRLVARWVRRKKFLVTFFVAFMVFSGLFFGRHALWYVPICLLMLPVFWALISLVELRRSFATPRNTEQFSGSRLYSALIAFCVVYFAFCFSLAGVATFVGRFDTKVAIGLTDKLTDSSLIAVTSSGILVGEARPFLLGYVNPFSASLHFLPFASIGSVGQKY